MSSSDDRNVILVHEPGGGRSIPLGAGGTVRLKVEGDHSQSRMVVYEFSMPPRTSGPPTHMHPHWDEVFYVLEGEVTFLMDGTEHVVAKGGCIFVAGNVPHTFWNASDTVSTNLTMLTPSGLEHYFDEVSVALANGEPAERVHALMAKHGIVTFEDTRSTYGAIDR